MPFFLRRRGLQTPGVVGPSPFWVRQGMVALFDQRDLIDVVSGVRASQNSGVPFVSANGMAHDYVGTANTQYPHQPQYAITDALSIATFIEVDALTNFNAIVSKQATNTTHVPYELRLGSISATNARVNLVRAGAAEREHRGPSSNVLSAGYSGPLVVTYPTGALAQTTGAAYTKNGAFPLSSVIGAGTGSATDDGTSSVWIGRRSTGTTQFDGRIFYVALFNRELSPNQAQSIVENPWQLFAPRRVWVPQTTASSAPTLSAAEIAALTSTTARPRVTLTF